MKLMDCYDLVWGERSSDRACGSGTTVKVELTRDGQIDSELPVGADLRALLDFLYHCPPVLPYGLFCGPAGLLRHLLPG